MRLPVLPLLITSSVSGLHPLGKLIQDGGRIGPIPQRCLGEVPYNPMSVRVLQFILANVDLRNRDAILDPGELPRPQVSVIRHIRRHFYIDQETLFSLIELNQENVPITEDKFYRHLSSQRNLHSNRTNICRLHIWYHSVVNPFAGSGMTFREMGLVREVHRKRILYRPPRCSLNRLANLELSRMQIPVLSGEKRKFEEISDAEVADFLRDILESPEDGIRLSESGSLSPIPRACLTPRKLKCSDSFRVAMEWIRNQPALPSTVEILRAVRVAAGHPQHWCLSRALRVFERNIVIPERSLNFLIELNKRNTPISSRQFGDAYFEDRLVSSQKGTPMCSLYAWYHSVINPNLGKSVNELGLVRHFVDDRGFYAPPQSVVGVLIDIELSRIVA